MPSSLAEVLLPVADVDPPLYSTWFPAVMFSETKAPRPASSPGDEDQNFAVEMFGLESSTFRTSPRPDLDRFIHFCRTAAAICTIPAPTRSAGR